jgi:pantothenate kinase
MSSTLVCNELADYLRTTADRLRHNEQFWLGIAGAPGSGKSTFSRTLLAELGEIAMVVPMDGYHYSRAELDQMPDPEEAHKRRGAPFTFNAERFVQELADARTSGEGLFPSFDHGTGDPVENDIRLIKGQHKLVVVEGNYLLLDDEPWIRLRSVLDETWYLDTDITVCRERVRQRFIATGRDERAARVRVEYNDGPNAELVARVSPSNANRIIKLI